MSLEAELEQQWAKERRRKRIAITIAIIILILLLIPWHCEEDRKGLAGPGQPGPAPLPKPAPLAPTQRFTRPEIGDRNRRGEPWALDLQRALADSRDKIRPCLKDDDWVAWTFAFNPASGEIQYRSLRDQANVDIDPEIRDCLKKVLPKKVQLPEKYPSAWTDVRLILSDRIGD